MSWRLNWTMQQFADIQMLRRNRELLHNPTAYYRSLFLKMVPGLYRRPIPFKLREGSFIIPVSSFMTAYIYKEIFAEADYDLPLEVSDPGILDIGANTGLFTLRMKQLYPNAQIACFEPEPSNFAQLQSLLRENNLQGVKVYKKAIGAETKTTTLFVHPKNIGGHSLTKQEGDWTGIEVELLSLEGALQELPGGVCHLMKLDCEGAEYEIIRGMDASLANRIRCIVFEGSGQLYDVKELHQHLKTLGYRLEPRHGLTVARLAAA